jgi:phage baseplate assembly protein W
MRGIDATTGKAINGLAHLQQSIGDILQTPYGSRVMRRDYGSLLPYLVDQPFHPATRLRLYAATATALMRWEPRVQLSRVSMELNGTPGQVVLVLEGTRTDTPVATAVSLTIPLSLSAAP